MKKRKRKKLLSFILKLSFSAFLIMLVLEEIDTTQVKKLLKTADYKYFFVAYLILVFTQVIGGLRMRYYLSRQQFIISKTYAVGMYYIGTLFNIILPGGIGGDGYKAFYFYKRFKFHWKNSVIGILRGRASGLFFLCVLWIAFAFFYKQHLTMIPHVDIVLIAALILIFPAYSICAKLFLKESLKIQLGAMPFSFAIQFLNLIAIILILNGLGNFDNIIGYIMVFLIANIVAVIPISFGGVGLREFTYVTMAASIGLNSDVGVSASLLFYLIYTSTAFIGVVPYILLRKMDAREFKIQRSNNKSKYVIHETEACVAA